MLPFIAGAIAGIAVVVAVQKRKEISHAISKGAKYAQSTVSDATSDMKEKVHEMTADEKSKEERPKEEIEEKKEESK
ncbi:MAG: hypothetical protein KAG56_06950 [Sulfurovaceae bacterium]|nr:hypothetical protein [Sulfurovaceae bacterium]